MSFFKEYEIIGEVLVNSKSQFLVYPITKDLWDTCVKQFENCDQEKYYLTFYDNKIFIDKMDIIIIYVKGKTSGIGGLFQTSSRIQKNNGHVNIFKDKNVQNYYVELEQYSVYDPPIKLSDISDCAMASNLYKSDRSFVTKYTKNSLTCTPIANALAKNILNSLMEFNNSKKEIIKNKDTSSIKSDLTESDNDVENSGDDNDISANSDDNAEDKNSNNEHKWGLIPILIIPCRKFTFPVIEFEDDEVDDYGNSPDDNAKCNYFREHIKLCTKCEIVNNNSIEVNNVLNKSIMSYMGASEDDPDVSLALDAYLNAAQYNPFGEFITEENSKLVHIIDEGSIYDESIILTIAIPQDDASDHENKDDKDNKDEDDEESEDDFYD